MAGGGGRRGGGRRGVSGCKLFANKIEKKKKDFSLVFSLSFWAERQERKSMERESQKVRESR